MPMYTLIHILYWVTNCLMFNFASAYLQAKGYTNGNIGLILALSYMGSALMQPGFATLFQKKGVRLNLGMVGVYAAAILLSLVILLVPMGKIVLACVIVLVFTLHSSMQPGLNSLHREFELGGIAMNFGVARGIGSAVFSASSAVIGVVMSRFAPTVLPGFYLCTMLALMVVLFFFRSPGAVQREEKRNHHSVAYIFRNYPRFALFLAGVVCLMLPYTFVENFLLQIMQSLGGTSAHQGIAISIFGIVEVPTMLLYSRASRRFGGNNLLRMAGWVWVVKNLVTLMATSPAGIYASCVLQFATMAVYIPGMVEYVANNLPEQDFLKGQALAGSAFTLACLVSTSLGGKLIDAMGVRTTLMMLQMFSVAGAVLFTVAIPRSRKNAG